MGMSDAFNKNKTVKVNSDGKAPAGLSAGDKVVTSGGTYQITGVNADGTYQSTLADKGVTTSNYSGTYDTAPTTSSNLVYNNSYTSTNGDMGLYAKNQMASGASWQDILKIYEDRQKKALNTEGLSQYADDALQNEMLSYIEQAKLKEQGEEARNTAYEDLLAWQANNQQPTYTAQYDPAMLELMNKILNRDDFSYDAQSDPLYQQYAAQYQQEGDRAMRETLANAAASAGGMNSYAITAAQQANNYYASQMANKVPELYQLAYNMYLQDKESDVQDLGILQSLDATQYNRYRDAMSDYYADKNFAYNKYLNDVAQGNWEQNFNYGQFVDDRNFNYGVSQDNQTQSNWETTRNDNLTQYDDALKREDEQIAKTEAQNQVYALLGLGQMPDSALLQAAGISEAFATAFIKGIKEEQARAAAGGGGKVVTGGGYVSGDDDEPVVVPQETGGMTDDEILEQAKKDLNYPTLTADSLADFLKLGFIRYDEEEGKFKHAMFGNNWRDKEDE